MNSDLFECIKNEQAKRLYVSMWRNCCVVNDAVIERSIVRKSRDSDKLVESHYSYCFSGDNKVETLIKVFGIPKENKGMFRQKFAMASGCYTQEYMRMTTLHSSTLCALMFFYNVSETNKLKIDGIGTFTKSVFKYKSPVFGKCHPSCMDVVLLGEDEEGKNVALFLESKFSEYYICVSKKSCPISERYLYNKYSEPLYSEEFLEKLGVSKSCSKDDMFVLTSDEKFYIDGIKQLISHYVGLRNELNVDCECECQEEIEQEEVTEAIKNGAKIIFGEILFDSTIGEFEMDDGKKYKEAYEEKYKLLAEKMNAEIEKASLKEQFCVLPNTLGYSMFEKDGMEYKLDKGVREFYFGKE